MSDVSRRADRDGARAPNSRATALQLRAATSQAASPTATRVNPPREWRYQTRPVLQTGAGPLVDVFNEAEEVLIVVDLGGFTRGEISLSMTPHQYIRGGRGTSGSRR